MQPHITISSLDADRLEALIDTLCADDRTSQALLDELARAEIRAPQDMPPQVATMNSSVRFTIGGSKEVRCMTLVYPKDLQQVENGISILTPIGAALLGLAVGDRIAWPRPDGQIQEVQLLEVTYQPERSGAFFR